MHALHQATAGSHSQLGLIAAQCNHRNTTNSHFFPLPRFIPQSFETIYVDWLSHKRHSNHWNYEWNCTRRSVILHLTVHFMYPNGCLMSFHDAFGQCHFIFRIGLLSNSAGPLSRFPLSLSFLSLTVSHFPLSLRRALNTVLKLYVHCSMLISQESNILST